jgi:GrpB-like predicted nucleotidyltransferase (UPF0157 family)
MRVVRFDAEVGRPVTRFGSDFRMAPLAMVGASDGDGAQITVLHLPAGGTVGPHPATSHQLFAVVAGTGRVTGGDGVERELGPGYGAVWDPGEEHEATSDHGLTAVVIEGTFAVEALNRTMEIVVADYDPAWPAWFAAVCDHVWPAVADVALRIDHVGSTSVPGLAAKPIIDMDIVVRSPDQVRPVIERLATIGYQWRGDLGIAGREAFEPLPDRSPILPPHHLYLVVENNKAHLDHWLLRDLLRSDPEARDQYAAVKRHSAATAVNDIETYGLTKSRLITHLLTRAHTAHTTHHHPT